MAFNYASYQKSKELQQAEQKKNQMAADYKESAKVQNLYNQYQTLQKNQPKQWLGGTYGTQVDNALNNILNRKAFTYDLNGDMLYQQYKEQYINQGKQAMMDTMGQAAALTGGYGNSYAQTVGQQTYQGYLQGLNDRIPELYNLAMQKYQMEGDQLNNNYSILKNQYDTEYGQYRDAVADWNTNVDRAYNVYNNERGNEQSQYNTNREYAMNAYNSLYNQEYGKYSDDYNRAFNIYQQNVAEQQAANDLAYKYAQLQASQESDKNALRVSELEKQLLGYQTRDELNDKIGTIKTVRNGNINTSNHTVYSYGGKVYKTYAQAHNAAEKDISDAYEAGYLTEEQASAMLDQLDEKLVQ